MKITSTIFIILLSLILPLCCKSATDNSDTTRVIILSVNDQHAKIDNYGKLKALVDQIRKENENVLLFAAGDNFTGNPIVDMYPEKGFPIIDLMNQAGFNATAIGNHEFDYGQKNLNNRMHQAKFPFLSANIIDSSANLSIKPYQGFTFPDGIKVIVISAIQLGSNGLPDSHPDNLKGIHFSDGLATIEKYNTLRDSCNIFIALTHLGFEKDIELAKEFPQLNLILGGHSHTLTKPAMVINDVTIMQAGSNVRYMSKATIYLVNGKVVKIVPEMLNITAFPYRDSLVNRKINEYNDIDELNKVIGLNISDISGSDELGSLMTDAVNSLNDIDFAFQNNGGIRIDFLKKGNITIKDIYNLDPFGNEVIVFKLKPSEIKSLILNAYSDAGNEPDLQVSGLEYTIITDLQGKAVELKMKTSNGTKLRNNKKYTVGMNSYIASSYKFQHKDPGKSLFVTTAQTLIDFIINQKQVNYQGTKRVFIKKISDN